MQMQIMSPCLRLYKKWRASGDTEPLLPQHADDTSRQRELHKKLHTYQMYRALEKGYMPSTAQATANLQTLLASDILNPEHPGLSDSGTLLVKHLKQWLRDFIALLEKKNANDEIQDFLWHLDKGKITLNIEGMETAGRVSVKADTVAG
jgi:hypothetical protein